MGYAETAINALMPQPVRPRSRLWGSAALSLIAVIDAGGKAADSLEARWQAVESSDGGFFFSGLFLGFVFFVEVWMGGYSLFFRVRPNGGYTPKIRALQQGGS